MSTKGGAGTPKVLIPAWSDELNITFQRAVVVLFVTFLKPLKGFLQKGKEMLEPISTESALIVHSNVTQGPLGAWRGR